MFVVGKYFLLLFFELTQNSLLGPKPGAPRNITVTEVHNGFLISWMPPSERQNLVQYYVIRYKTDGPWKDLSKGHIRPEDTSYLGKKLKHLDCGIR